MVIVATSVGGFFGWQRLNQRPPIPESMADHLFWKAKQLKSFSLVDYNHKTFGLEQMEGKWNFIFFGYTHCPDICPMTMGVMAMAFKTLEKQHPQIAKEIQALFVSVDPERDTPEHLKNYVPYFHPEFSGATGSIAQIDAFSRQLGAFYMIHPPEKPGESYLVSHNATIFVIDPRMRIYARFSQPHAPLEMAKAFVEIHAFYNKHEAKRWFFF